MKTIKIENTETLGTRSGKHDEMITQFMDDIETGHGNVLGFGEDELNIIQSVYQRMIKGFGVDSKCLSTFKCNHRLHKDLIEQGIYGGIVYEKKDNGVAVVEEPKKEGNPFV